MIRKSDLSLCTRTGFGPHSLVFREPRKEGGRGEGE